MTYKEQCNTWIELSRLDYFRNLDFIRKVLPSEAEISVLLKANAYGHGWKEIYSLAKQWGISFFCVFSLIEAIELVGEGLDGNVLVLGNIPKAQLAEAVNAEIHMGIYNAETLSDLEKACLDNNSKASIHLKLETGFNRQGIDEFDLPGFLSDLNQTSRLIVEGVCTHFSTADEPSDQSYLNRQVKCFKEMVNIIREHGFRDFKQHIANSAAAVARPDLGFDMVRIGILQFGLWPSDETMRHFLNTQTTQSLNGAISPVLSWKTRVAQIKEIRNDTLVGYGGTYQAKKGERLAIISVGYADGFDRGLSNKGEVLIGGKRAPVRGRVSMNLTAVDISSIPEVQLGDEVVLIGSQGQDRISAEEIAGWLDTINYEVVTRISSRIPRMVI